MSLDRWAVEEYVLMSMQSFDDKAILELESEIRYLRQLLDSNGIVYDYQAYKESLASTEEGGIEFPELTREHAIAFYGVFRLLSLPVTRMCTRKMDGSIIKN